MTNALLSLVILLAGGQGPKAPELTAGHQALSFTATDVNGKTVHFPQDFKGKIVMLDFWATWCGPCMGEVPNIVKVYKASHPKGFEILGISLDRGASIKELAPVTKEKGMTWDQVLDGPQMPQTKQYHVEYIPRAFLVNGTTGMIVAEGESIRGENLQFAVDKALAAASP